MLNSQFIIISQKPLFDCVVMVRKRNILSSCNCNPSISCSAYTLILLVNNSYLLVSASKSVTKFCTSIARSIINKNSNVNIGNLCLKYGGGGHAAAGTCQIDNDKVDAELPGIIEALQG